MAGDWFNGMAVVGLRVLTTPSALSERAASGSGTFYRALIGPRGCESVQFRAHEESLWAARISGRFPAPRAERILLQRSPVAESKRPWQRARRIHQAQMQRRLGRTLTSRQECDAGNCGR